VDTGSVSPSARRRAASRDRSEWALDLHRPAGTAWIETRIGSRASRSCCYRQRSATESRLGFERFELFVGFEGSRFQNATEMAEHPNRKRSGWPRTGARSGAEALAVNYARLRLGAAATLPFSTTAFAGAFFLSLTRSRLLRSASMRLTTFGGSSTCGAMTSRPAIL